MIAPTKEQISLTDLSLESLSSLNALQEVFWINLRDTAKKGMGLPSLWGEAGL
ncbi:hypothetical protein [Insolitispirillum peregrinum]|uniref:hypothetical protein n=1 Tax=Insolitispirillum peregrinum TaxID=80876 RepID=UPI00360F44BC